VAYNEELAADVRERLRKETGLVEKKMFGGLAFLVHGNMSVGVHGDELIVRVDPSDTDALLGEPGVRVFDVSGRPMKGWLLVGGKGLEQEQVFATWIGRGVSYARSLPAK
jgi:hypothetical protein